MNYRHIPLQCQCGEIPEHIAEVGLTDDRCLVVHWWCAGCQKVVYLAKPLTDCWRECPSPAFALDRVLPQAGRDAYAEQDAEFLRRIGVRAS